MGSLSFSKKRRILNHTEFVKLNRWGKRFHSENFTVIVKQNGLGMTRLGVTASKRTGNAVKRNRIKRLIREFFRLNQSHFPQGYDIVIAAKKGASYLDLWKTKEELGEILFSRKTFSKT